MARPPRPLTHRLRVQLRYLGALLRRFKVTFILLVVVQLGGSLVPWLGYTRNGAHIGWPPAFDPKSTEVLGPDDEIVVQAPFDVFSKASAPAPTVAKGD